MFDHARDFKIHNARFHEVRNGNTRLHEDRSRTSIIGSGNSYRNSYNNSFNDNSRRERVSHHHSTHHHGPTNNIDKAGNVNLGSNYGSLNMSHIEEPEYRPRSAPAERQEYRRPQDQFYEDDQSYEPSEYSIPGYPEQDFRPQSQGYDQPIPPPREGARGGPPPFPQHCDGPQRTFTMDPQAQWGSKNPYLRRPNDYQGEDYYPPPPHPPSAPPTHRQPVYRDDRTPSSYGDDRHDRDDVRSRASDARDPRREYPPHMEDRGPRHDMPYNQPRPYPQNYASPHPPMGGPEVDYRRQHHSRSRGGQGHSRSPSPGYDSSDSDDSFGGRARGTRRKGGDFRQLDKAMSHMDRMADKMARMRF